MGAGGTGVDGGRGQSLVGRTLYVPEMSHSGAVAFAAAFRALGLEARVCPASDARTLELGGRYTSGEECLPARVTLGNFLKVIEQPGFRPEKTAFFMPTADGPCRFGQYAPYLKKVLRDIGLPEVMVLSPTSRDGYAELAEHKNELMRNALRGIMATDALRKMLHRTRPHETEHGAADAVFAHAVAQVEKVLERPGPTLAQRLRELVKVLGQARDAFRAVPASYSRQRPLIGVVGEIFCRLTPFTNDSLIRRLEQFGAECSLAHVTEWVWYTNVEAEKRIRQSGRTFSKEMLIAKIKNHIQLSDEHRIFAPFHDDFHGYQEPSVHTIFKHSAPYLPNHGALGEMTLSVGKAVFHYHQGCDGVVDISPFTCMNAIVTEAIYPQISRDHDDIPIRNFYFDGTHADIDRDVGIFMELAQGYQARKQVKRVYPSSFSGQ